LMTLVFVSVPVMAADDEKDLGFWVEVKTQSNGVAGAVGWYEKELTKNFGFYAAVIVETGKYREFYVGPYWKPTDWLQLGVAIGRESDQGTNSFRRNAFAQIDTEKVFALAIYENGGSGPWHRVHAVYHLNEKSSVGGMTERFLGHGPRAEYKIAKNVTVWSALLRNQTTKESTSLFAVNFSF